MDFRFIVTVLPAETPHCGISCSKNTKKPKLPPRKSHCSDLCLVRNNHGFSKGKIRSVRPSVSPYIKTSHKLSVACCSHLLSSVLICFLVLTFTLRRYSHTLCTVHFHFVLFTYTLRCSVSLCVVFRLLEMSIEEKGAIRSQDATSVINWVSSTAIGNPIAWDFIR